MMATREESMASQHQQQSSEENIRVVIRTRPLNSREIKNKEYSCLSSSTQNEIIIRKNEKTAESFRCNGVFSSNVTQQEFFESCGIINLLDSVFHGYRSCAFAYGQTGAGKTHTIIGTTSQLDCHQEDCGILGRSLTYFYNKLSTMNCNYIVRISCLELYQENIYDLLSDEREKTSLLLREHPVDGFFVEGAESIECQTCKMAEKVINKALKSRHIGSHDLNHRSNRSHFITEISLDLPERQSSSSSSAADLASATALSSSGDEMYYTVMGRMTFVDLAGSERLKSTNSSGKILQETGSINSSLYVLGKVISGLSKLIDTTDYQKDIPYRDSKLTKLLINSLGGASRTMIISCVSESSGSITESLRTIHFSMSAARIRNRPIRYLDPQQKLILELRDEIKRLKRENYRLRDTLSREPSQDSEIGSRSFHLQPSYQQLESQQSQQQQSHFLTQHSTQLSPVSSTSSPLHNNKNYASALVPAPLPHISSQPTLVNNYCHPSSFPTSSSYLSRSKSQKELPKWNNNVVVNSTIQEEKFDQMAKNMFEEYLKFEQKLKEGTQFQMESSFPPNHPLNRTKEASKKGSKKTSNPKTGQRQQQQAQEKISIPHIKEGSARVLIKPKGTNPYTAHLRKSKSSQKQNQPSTRPHIARNSFDSPQSTLPELISPHQFIRPSGGHSKYSQQPSDGAAGTGAGAGAAASDSPTAVSSSHPLPVIHQRKKKVSPESHGNYFDHESSSSMNSQLESFETLSPLKNIKLNIQKLENQLLRQRQEIESNPKKATKEKWSQLESLEDEVREMRLELHLSEQLQDLFPGDDKSPPVASSDRSSADNNNSNNNVPSRSIEHIDHFPLPAINSNSSSPTPSQESVLKYSPPSVSSKNRSSTKLPHSPIDGHSGFSITSKTDDSLTYSTYHPSETIRTTIDSHLSSSSSSQALLKTQSHSSSSTISSPYLETLQGERISLGEDRDRDRERDMDRDMDKGKDKEKEKEGNADEEEYNEDDYEEMTTPPLPTNELIERKSHKKGEEKKEVTPRTDEQSYLDDDFEADEYGEEDFEPL